MGSLEQYHVLYYSFFFFLFWICIGWQKYGGRVSSYFLYFALFILSGIIAFQPLDLGTDIENYVVYYRGIEEKGLDFFKDYSLTESPLFYFIFWICSVLFNFRICLFVISWGTFFFTYRFARFLCKSEKIGVASVLFCCIVIMHVFINQQFNIIRAGCAMPFVLFFTYYLYLHRFRKAFVFALIACSLHITMVIPIFIACVVYFVRISLCWYYFLYCLCILCAYLGIGIHRLGFLIGIESRQIENYMINNQHMDYKIGFRWDFILFNTFFLICFSWLKKQDLLLLYYIRFYIACSCLFFLWLYIPFCDRIGAFSWNLIPVILYMGICKNSSSRQLINSCFVFLFLFLTSIILV